MCYCGIRLHFSFIVKSPLLSQSLCFIFHFSHALEFLPAKIVSNSLMAYHIVLPIILTKLELDKDDCIHTFFFECHSQTKTIVSYR